MCRKKLKIFHAVSFSQYTCTWKSFRSS